jgi:uncharacterized protein YbaP (TraB family)
VPDPAVLALPDVVRRALEASDVFSGEIPLDAGTQASLLGKIMLPQGQDLRKLAGEDVFTRVVRSIAKVLGNSAPPVQQTFSLPTLSSMKPWAVMSQVEALEFLPDVMAGRQPLDVMLYSMAEKSGKELGALETVDEQVAVFEGFTNEEQVKMLIEALDEMEKPNPSGVSATRRLVDLYLAGDLTKLAEEADKQSSEDKALSKKLSNELSMSAMRKWSRRSPSSAPKSPPDRISLPSERCITRGKRNFEPAGEKRFQDHSTHATGCIFDRPEAGGLSRKNGGNGVVALFTHFSNYKNG